MQLTNSYSQWKDADEGATRKKRKFHIELQAAALKALATDYHTLNQLVKDNVNWSLAERLVKELSKKKLIESKTVRGRMVYSATQKGTKWLKYFETLLRD